MSTPAAPSEGSTQTPAAAPSTPSTSTPSAVFADSGTPEWVKSAGLQEAHNKGATTPETPSAAPAATPTPAAQPSAQPAPAAPVAPTAPTVDPTAIARAVAEGIRTGNQPAPAGPSDEEVARQLGIVHFTPETYKAAFGVDATPEQVKAFNDYGQGVAKQAVTIATILFEQKLNALKSSFEPYTQVIQRQERDRVKTEFFAKHKDLSGYEELVTQQYQLAMASGKTFPTLEAAGQYVADQTRGVLNKLGITPTAVTTTNGTPNSGKSAPQSRQMAPQSMGGKGSGASAAAKPSSTQEAVWGTK